LFHQLVSKLVRQSVSYSEAPATQIVLLCLIQAYQISGIVDSIFLSIKNLKCYKPVIDNMFLCLTVFMPCLQHSKILCQFTFIQLSTKHILHQLVYEIAPFDPNLRQSVPFLKEIV